jgi:hypothetical protein
MRFRMPWPFSWLSGFPGVVGHSGASGALLFYCPEWDLFIVGSINQADYRGMPYELMIKLLLHARKAA